jgi:DNA-binding GntR family transcriptional regulator
MLQREGLVIAAPNRQICIASLTAADFEGISIARLALEAVAIRITVPTLTTAEFAALEGYMAQMEHYQQRGDLGGLREPHRAFHRTLVAAAGPRVNAEIDELRDQAERYRLRFGILGNWEESRAAHRAILSAAATGDVNLAADCLAIHDVHTIALVFGALDHDYNLSRLRTTLKAIAPGAEAALRVNAD